MQLNNRNLLGEASRTSEIVVGWICALISIVFVTLFGYLAYIVGWRNPRIYGSHDLLHFDSLAVFAILLVIAVGFSVFAFRLLQRKKSNRRLMSPLVLRVWGTFFALGGVLVLADCIVNHRWEQLAYDWEILAGSIAMAIAAFALAKIWKDNDRVA
jgi:hypothetical protein